MINSIKFFAQTSKYSLNRGLLLLFCSVFAAFLSCTSDPDDSDDLFSEVSQINLANISNRSDLSISDIAFDSTGRIYVCSKKGQVFSISKQTVKEINLSVNEESTPWTPRAISTDQSDKLYVAGPNHVWIFDASGKSLGGYETDISYPTSIAVASDNMIYIAGPKGEYVLHQYGKNGEEKPALEAFKEKSQGKNSGGTFVFERKDMGSFQVKRSSNKKNGGEKSVIKKEIKNSLQKNDDGQLTITIDPDKEPQNKVLMMANPSVGGMVQTWKNGVVFAAKTPYHLIAYQDGQVVTKHQRPELGFESGSNVNRSGNNIEIKVHNTGKGIGVTVTDEFVFYCYSLPGSDIYIDIYDHNLNLVEIDVGIDGTLIGADKEGYLYLKRKVNGREELFRAKFNPESLRKSQ